MPLTEQQYIASTNRGGNLLVSAAAGSGKTKVLVERLMEYLKDPDTHLDDFLIITYTKAAAAELRGKIAARLTEARTAPQANRNLSLLLRRDGDRTGAEKVWREMIRRGQMDIFPYVELSKALEHRDKNYEEALLLTRRAMTLTDDEREKNQLKAREARLMRKLKESKQLREE